MADRDTGICNSCKTNFCLDKNDRKCKINTEDNEIKYCVISENQFCTSCERGYYLGSDSKCASTLNCLESEFGICKVCKEGYHLISNDKCSNVEHCINADTIYYLCEECEDGYYYSNIKEKCEIVEGNFANCKFSSFLNMCSDCKINYYLNYSDFLCYDSTKDEKFFNCKSTDIDGTVCEFCKDGYFLNSFDKKCGKVDNCKFNEDNNINRCKECEDYYCLNVKDGKCYENDVLNNLDDKIYIKCLYTNEEGTACEKCLEGYEVGENGHCVDVTRCEKIENGVCIKRKNMKILIFVLIVFLAALKYL